MHVKWRFLIALVSIILMLGLPVTTAYAHGARIEYTVDVEIEIVASYDSGEPMAGAQVVVYAPDNPSSPWLTGVCDDEGRFSFVPAMGWTLKQPDKMLQVDTEKGNIARNYAVDVAIEGNCKEVLQEIITRLEQENVAQATRDNIQGFTQESVDLVNQMMRQASEKNDYARMGKLQKMVEVLQEASAPPPEVAFIEELLEAPDDAAIEKLLNENEDRVNEDLTNTLGGLMAQLEAQGQGGEQAKELTEKLESLYKTVLKFSMKKKMG